MTVLEYTWILELPYIWYEQERGLARRCCGSTTVILTGPADPGAFGRTVQPGLPQWGIADVYVKAAANLAGKQTESKACPPSKQCSYIS
jgi:hypothetical protein